MNQKNYKRMGSGNFLKEVGTDAQKWTEAFIQHYPEGTNDPGVLLGWFANSIMAGHYEAVRRNRKNPKAYLESPTSF